MPFGQPKRGHVGAQSWGSAITPQYPEADPDRGRRSLSPRDREKSGRTSERDRREGDGQGRAGRLLKVSMGVSFGVNYILPLLPEFLGRYPRIRADWQFDNRQVDLIAEGFDAAIGGGFDLSPAVISRVLAPLHIIAVASPDYMRGRTPPIDPTGLSEFDGIVLRSSLTGRLRHRNHARYHRHRASSCIERNNCCERSRGNVSGGCAQSWRRAGFYAGNAALLGEQCARAPRPKLVCRSRSDLTLFRDPHAAAGQNARLCRFRPGGFSAGSLGRTLRGKSRIGTRPIVLSLAKHRIRATYRPSDLVARGVSISRQVSSLVPPVTGAV